MIIIITLQKIHKSCQGSTQNLATALVKASMTGEGGPTKTWHSSPCIPRHKSNRLVAISTPTSTTKMMPKSDQRSSFQPGSHQLKEDLLPLRRSRRAAALRSPYGSPVCAGLKRQVRYIYSLLAKKGLKERGYAGGNFLHFSESN